MASQSHSRLRRPILFLAIASLQILYSSSSSLLLPLSHALSKAPASDVKNLLKASSLQSSARFRRRREVSLPLSSGSDYILSLSLGHGQGSRAVNMYMDTGSDLVWSPCEPFECILCEGKPDVSSDSDPLNISYSAAFVPCSAPACAAVHSSAPSSDLCAIAGCPLEDIETASCATFRCPIFYYAYGDGSLVAGLRSDRLSVPAPASPAKSSAAAPLIQLRNFTFGCAHTALAEPIGVAGFGRGPLSLPAQLAAFSPHLGNRFSYCLVSHSFNASRLRHPSPLILGRRPSPPSDAGSGEEFVYTRMLDNPKHPYFYSVGLEAIYVGGKRLPATEELRRVNEEGKGGMVIDSGTTLTILPAAMYASLAKEFDLRMGMHYERASKAEEEMGMGLCYYCPGESGKVPKVALHFSGNASVILPARNYFLGFERVEEVEGRMRKVKVGCLMMMNGGEIDADSGEGAPATLGNFQQQGIEVVYDLEKGRVGFARRRCTRLWDALSRS